jgi:hypothetical protein
MRLSERQIYLAVWLVALAAVIGIAAGIIALKLLARPTPPTLIGDIVIDPARRCAGFHPAGPDGAAVSLSQLKGRWSR